MSNTQIKGRTVKVKQPAIVLFSLFSDLKNFTNNLPSDIREKAELRVTSDTLLAKVQGFELGIKVEERVPYSYIKYVQYGNSPIPFTFTVFFTSLDESETDFNLELNTELNGMLKMMLGGKLQEVVDKVTDEMERGLGGASMR